MVLGGGVTQVLEHLPGRREALSSNAARPKNKIYRERKERISMMYFIAVVNPLITGAKQRLFFSHSLSYWPFLPMQKQNKTKKH
jgi:hypothetical protein